MGTCSSRVGPATLGNTPQRESTPINAETIGNQVQALISAKYQWKSNQSNKSVVRNIFDPKLHSNGILDLKRQEFKRHQYVRDVEAFVVFIYDNFNRRESVRQLFMSELAMDYFHKFAKVDNSTIYFEMFEELNDLFKIEFKTLDFTELLTILEKFQTKYFSSTNTLELEFPISYNELCLIIYDLEIRTCSAVYTPVNITPRRMSFIPRLNVFSVQPSRTTSPRQYSTPIDTNIFTRFASDIHNRFISRNLSKQSSNNTSRQNSPNNGKRRSSFSLLERNKLLGKTNDLQPIQSNPGSRKHQNIQERDHMNPNSHEGIALPDNLSYNDSNDNNTKNSDNIKHSTNIHSQRQSNDNSILNTARESYKSIKKKKFIDLLTADFSNKLTLKSSQLESTKLFTKNGSRKITGFRKELESRLLGMLQSSNWSIDKKSLLSQAYKNDLNNSIHERAVNMLKRLQEECLNIISADIFQRYMRSRHYCLWRSQEAAIAVAANTQDDQTKSNDSDDELYYSTNNSASNSKRPSILRMGSDSILNMMTFSRANSKIGISENSNPTSWKRDSSSKKRRVSEFNQNAAKRIDKSELNNLLVIGSWLTSLISISEGLNIGILVGNATKPGVPIAFANKHFLTSTMQDKSDILGESCRKVLCEEGDIVTSNLLLNNMNAKGVSVMTIKHAHSSGAVIYNTVGMKHVNDEEGKSCFIVFIVVDELTDGIWSTDKESSISKALGLLPNTLLD